MKILLCLLFIGVNKFSLGLNKHWLPNQEWNSEYNWAEGRVPDLGSHIIFPLEMRNVVGLPPEGELRMSTINLPADGVLILAKNGGLQIVDKLEKNEKIGTWSKKGPLFWADPQNWNSTSEAVPHLERIPCQVDMVVLPSENRVFNIHLPMQGVKVKGVLLDSKEIPLSEWNYHLDDKEFSSTRRTVRYSELTSCERCLCQEGKQEDYLEEVCDIQRPRCGYPKCENPLKVEGHCCPYCGARLSFSSIVYTRSLSRFTNEALKSYHTSISWYIRTTWEGGVEVLIAEKGQYTGEGSLEALRTLESYLIDEGVQVLKTENSGGPVNDNRLAGVLGPIFGGLIFALISLTIVFLYNGYSYLQILQGTREIWFSIREGFQSDNAKGNSYKFARFQNFSEGGVQLSGSDKLEDDNEPTSSGGRFENPLYKSRRESKKELGVEKIKEIDFNSPVSLMSLSNQIEGRENLEELELTKEEISESEQ
ncbi:protein amnionless [Leptopilina heterotoma]|uniref:protein amnionless n=1 Tax=Leptopilina heterotoma TaxID=63436 RepID=UPI001CA87802|nr:protein amnionless [Leptopilina heterotoma]